MLTHYLKTRWRARYRMKNVGVLVQYQSKSDLAQLIEHGISNVKDHGFNLNVNENQEKCNLANTVCKHMIFHPGRSDGYIQAALQGIDTGERKAPWSSEGVSSFLK